MQTKILKELYGDRMPPHKTLVNGINDERYHSLSKLKPHFGPFRFVTIANGPGGFRVWYKGLDLMLKVMGRLHDAGYSFEYTIIGNWSDDEITKLYALIPEGYRSYVKFTGECKDFSMHLNGASFYLHCARGEAWGISVLEGMAAGLVPIVSDFTGSKEAVEKISPELIVPLDENELFNKILQLTGLPVDRLTELSARAQTVAGEYLESRAVEGFKDSFRALSAEIG
jgi:glycosyltransferase involved in cell wall biosynthesis